MATSEITVEVLCDKDTLFKLLKDKGFSYRGELLIDDYYYTHVPMSGDVEFRELLSNSFLLRNLRCNDKKSKAKSVMYHRLVYKKKEYDINDRVISERKISTELPDTRVANEIFQQAGMTNWCVKNVTAYDYRRKDLQVLVQEVEGLGLFLEMEQPESITGTADEVLDKLVEILNNIEIPVGPDYHVSIAYLLHLKKNKKVTRGFRPIVIG